MTNDEADRKDHRVFLAYAPLGILPVVWGALWICYAYVWASMVDPNLNEHEQNVRILRGMLPDMLPGVALILAGLTFSTMCVVHVITGSVRFRPTGTKMAVLLGLLGAIVVISTLIFE